MGAPSAASLLAAVTTVPDDFARGGLHLVASPLVILNTDGKEWTTAGLAKSSSGRARRWAGPTHASTTSGTQVRPWPPRPVPQCVS